MIEIQNEHANCLRCGRRLKSEESKKLGFGQVCWEKWQHETKTKKLFTVDTETNDSNNISDNLSNKY